MSKKFLLFSFVLLLLLASSCDPQKRAARRAERLVSKAKVIYPEMFQDTTIYFETEVITPERQLIKDSVYFEYGKPYVTENDGIITSVTVYEDTTMSLHVQVPPDTTTVKGSSTVEVIRPRVSPPKEKSFFDQLSNLLWLVIVLVLIISVLRIIKLFNE